MRYGDRFFLMTLLWGGGLLGVVLLHQLLVGLSPDRPWNPLALVHQVPAWLGLLLPFTAFAGGTAVALIRPAWRAGVYGLPVALVAYLLMAYGAPVAEHRVFSGSGETVTDLFPMGPNTPSGLRQLRHRVRAEPPERFSYSLSRPLTWPPGWIDYLLHSPLATSLFAVLAALLGHQAARVTTGLSPPARRNARWALGLISAMVFFLAEAAGGEWVRGDLNRSGVLGAWVPMAAPLLVLAILVVLGKRRRSSLPRAPEPEIR